MIIANKFLYGNKAANNGRKCKILHIFEVHAFNSKYLNEKVVLRLYTGFKTN